MTGVAYSLFAGQPLTILGSTGPVLVFEKILFKFCKSVQLTYNQIIRSLTRIKIFLIRFHSVLCHIILHTIKVYTHLCYIILLYYYKIFQMILLSYDIGDACFFFFFCCCL